MSDFFAFEADFVDGLRCIPMQVRLKLDSCGVKLKLFHWNQLTPAERETLVSMACTTSDETQDYRTVLQNLLTQKTGSPASTLPIEENPPWENKTMIPPEVQEKAQDFEITLSLAQWASLTPLQRFALIKLSRPSHENRNFYPALKEFGLVQ